MEVSFDAAPKRPSPDSELKGEEACSPNPEVAVVVEVLLLLAPKPPPNDCPKNPLPLPEFPARPLLILLNVEKAPPPNGLAVGAAGGVAVGLQASAKLKLTVPA